MQHPCLGVSVGMGAAQALLCWTVPITHDSSPMQPLPTGPPVPVPPLGIPSPAKSRLIST